MEGFVQLWDDRAKLSLLLAVKVIRINHDKLQVGRFSFNILTKRILFTGRIVQFYNRAPREAESALL